MVPHARTLRKAREQVKMMVVDGVSLCQIKKYLSRWLFWWIKTAGIWNYHDIANRYMNYCWDPNAAEIAALAFQRNDVTGLCTCESIALAA